MNDEMLKYLDDLSQEDLDEMVTEAKADEAAEINNAGSETQTNYLLTRWHGRTFVMEG